MIETVLSHLATLSLAEGATILVGGEIIPTGNNEVSHRNVEPRESNALQEA